MVKVFNFRMLFSQVEQFLTKLGIRFMGRYEILETYPLGGKIVYSILFWR